MYQVVFATYLMLALLLCQLLGCLAAPAIARQPRSLSDVHHGHRDRETKLSLVLAREDDMSLDDSAATFSDQLFNSRRKRDVTSDSDLVDGSIDLALPGEVLTSSQRRQRRSAAWWMHAVVQLCNSNRSMCRRIEVDEGSLHMKIRLEDI